MGSLFYTILFLFAVWTLHKDFKKTPGFVSQKIQHVFFIFFLFTSNIDAFKAFFAFIRNWSILDNLEYLPFTLSFVFTVSIKLMALLVYVLSFALLVRADFARKIIVWIIPIYILNKLMLVYNVFISIHNIETGAKIIWVAILFLTIYAVIFFVYKGEKMKRFFHAKKMLA